MRWCAVVFLLVVSFGIQAGEVLLIPENNPKPVYPKALSRAGITGDVRVRFTVHADGSVHKVSILESDHPDFAEAARVALAQWRFKSWTVDQDTPAEREVVAPVAFRLDQDMPLHVNKWLTRLRCHEINEDVRRYPASAWVDMPAFRYTRIYLSNTFNSAQLSNEQRLTLIARLNERVPIIVRRCVDSPSIRFMSLLPEEIRRLL